MQTLNRAQLLGGAAVLVAAPAVGALAGAARADTLPDGDLAYLRMLVATELLGADFYAKAAAARPYRGALGRNALGRAHANEQAHYAALSTLLANAGQLPATAADIDFTYPGGAFRTTGAVTKLAVALETVFLGAYLGAVAALQSASLVQPLARIAAHQAQHLTVFSQLLGRPGFKAELPAPLTIDAATQALAAYTS
jgi:hypothetical protein